MNAATTTKLIAGGIAIAAALSTSPAQAEMLKDLADVRGARANQIVGYGLVVGLQGTGDGSDVNLNQQSIINMLRRLGTHVDGRRLRLRNVAAVVVTAELPPFIAAGQKIDVTVSSIGSATSLQGGTLLPTPLKGADLNVYAVAQGPLSVGGFLAGEAAGTRITKNHTTVGRVPDGALIEREVPVELRGRQIEITLRSPDFTTAVRIAAGISNRIGTVVATATSAQSAARARDAGTVLVDVPESYDGRLPELIAALESVEVTPAKAARVVINERTGTVVLGDKVELSPVAIAHGGLTLEVRKLAMPSQPGAFSSGETVVVENTTVKANEREGTVEELGGDASLSDVVKALNALGVTPRDLVAILQALKSSGALHAQLVIQ